MFPASGRQRSLANKADHKFFSITSTNEQKTKGPAAITGNRAFLLVGYRSFVTLTQSQAGHLHQNPDRLPALPANAPQHP